MATVETSDRPYRTTNEIARQLEKHPSWVIRQIKEGTLSKSGRIRLKAVRAPGSWLIKPEWLDEFLEAVAADRLQADDTDTQPAPRARLSTKRRAELEQVDATFAKEGW
jgi:hypothetical protein